MGFGHFVLALVSAVHALRGEEVAHEDCATWESVRNREAVRMCSIFDDEKTFCGESMRKVRMGGMRYMVPCVYDGETHHCRENFMCNIPDSKEERWTDSPKKSKKTAEILEAAARRRAEGDEPGETDCEDVDTLLRERAFRNCFNTVDSSTCDLSYSNKTMAGEYYYVPCVLTTDLESCVEDIGCAVLAPFNFTDHPTVAPGVETQMPTFLPTDRPTFEPTPSPTNSPTESPTASPTPRPTLSPTNSPTLNPTASPTESPTDSPTKSPTESPTQSPTDSPTKSPTESPTESPTDSPTKSPTESPTESPTDSPTKSPTESPTESPTDSPTKSPTESPTESPTDSPTKSPTESPTESPTDSTLFPSARPTRLPTSPPTKSCAKYAWTRDSENYSGFTDKKGKFRKDGTCCHQDCPICSADPKVCKGQKNLLTGITLPDNACCRQQIQKGATCSERGSAPCYHPDPFQPECDDITNKGKCRKTNGCSWAGGLCLNELGWSSGKSFQFRCPCQENEQCTLETLAQAAIIVFDADTYTKLIQAQIEHEEEFEGAKGNKVVEVPGYQKKLLDDGILQAFDIINWYEFAGCDAGLFFDVVTPPVHICLTDSMTSYHVLYEARETGFQIGKPKFKIDSVKTADTVYECFRTMTRKYGNKNLELVTWEIDQENRVDHTCYGYERQDTTFGKPSTQRRAVSYRKEEKWGCPSFNSKQRNCGRVDVKGYLMNLRVDNVGITDDKCMCQLMCEARDVNNKYVAWTWNSYEGMCICSYSAKKNQSTGNYVAALRWNNLTGMMNGNDFQMA